MDKLKVFYGKDKFYAFDGFKKDDFDRLSNSFKGNYQIPVEARETSLRGWNWGKAELQGPDLAFLIAGKPAFQLPVSSIHNSSINKTEVTLEFLPLEHPEGSSRKKGLGDQLMEMRLHIPGSEASARKRAKVAAKAAKKEEDQNGMDVDGIKKENGDEEEEDEEELNTDDEEGVDQAAAEVFHENIKDRAELGQVQGDAIVTFSEVQCATPRGKYDVELYNGFIRLRNKSYDYKILFGSVKKLFTLPRNDEINVQLVIQLDPAIRQGQTRYTFLVMQFAREDVMEAELNLDDPEVKTNFPDLKEKYEDPSYAVVANILKAVSGTKIVAPSHTFESHSGQQAVKCNMRTNEGFLYFLDKYVLFTSKQPLLVAYNDIRVIRSERVSGAMASARTFDLRIELRTEASDVTFSAINKEELNGITDFFVSKKLKFRNEIVDDMVGTQQALAAIAGVEASSDSDEDSDNSAKKERKANKMDVDDDEDSEVDEDFKAESESDVAEEFDENYESSAGSDAEAAPSVKKKKSKSKATDEGEDAPPKKKQRKEASSDAEEEEDSDAS